MSDPQRQWDETSHLPVEFLSHASLFGQFLVEMIRIYLFY